MTAAPSIPPLDPAVVGPWLANATGDGRWAQLDATLLQAGKSNLTYVLSSGGRELILRRPPTGHLLPSAHDMRREARVIGALSAIGFPVPELIAVEETGKLLGRPFYVMQRVNGLILRDDFPPGYAETRAARLHIVDALVQTLVRLHAVDYARCGLGNFGRPAGYMQRQLRRWTAQSEATAGDLPPGMASLANELQAALPARCGETLVHGDYRLDNCVLDAQDPARIVAVLDWEMSTLGDPLADLGLLLVYWHDRAAGELAGAPMFPNICSLDGIPTRGQIAQLYGRSSGRDLSDLPFYVAFGYFKLAVVVQGVVARSSAGAMGSKDFSGYADYIPLLTERGRQILDSGEIDGPPSD
jgi:aminoglycoside phosphotransferase (APT) family kinase protein